MSLDAPNLDGRKFQEIVDDVKRQIGLRCPDWTDHNVSDPGVTLIELFAYMTEQMLFQLNQVPERNYIKFLELLGINLESPAPAQTDLLFRLSRPIGDKPGEEVFERTLRAYETVAATIRTETEEAIEFIIDVDLNMKRPLLTYILAVPATVVSGSENDLTGSREFESKEFEIFSKVPVQKRHKNIANGSAIGSDALYLGFKADISGNLVRLDAECTEASGTGLNPNYPSQVWEYWSKDKNRWDRLDVPLETDTTKGFSQIKGFVELRMPHGLIEQKLAGDKRAYWVRCRYTTEEEELPTRGPRTEDRPGVYTKSPKITRLNASVRGGIAPASNCIVVTKELLGQSDGTPGQVFKLRHAPVLPRRLGETLLVGPQDASLEATEVWEEKTDFADSLVDPKKRRDDKHYVLDARTGEVFFGPNILQPDGSAIQHGKIPEKGKSLFFQRYRYGGGVEGNVRENQVRVLKSSIPYIAEVINPRIAQGGRNIETLERAKMRARTELRVLERAVTAEDYEFLAVQASKVVGRAHCVQCNPDPAKKPQESDVPLLPLLPGEVRVLIIPTLDRSVLSPRPPDLHVPDRVIQDVREYLEDRRLLTTKLEIQEPVYIYVSTEITLVPHPRVDVDQLKSRVEECLSTYLHPLLGGPNGTGWPFGRDLTLADIYTKVAEVPGVAFLLDARLFKARVQNKTDGQLGPNVPVTAHENKQVGFQIKLANNEMFCTNKHTVSIKTMGDVGRDES